MPVKPKSQRQMRWIGANHPEWAAEWEPGVGKGLPEKVKTKKKRKKKGK